MARARAVALVLLLGLLALPAAGEGLRLRWLGVAGFSVDDGDAVLLHDPFVSRPGVLRLLLRRYQPDEAVIARLLAAGGPAPELARARAILVGHSHFDHSGDVAAFATRTGARVLGSATTGFLARAYGARDDQVEVVGFGEAASVAPFEVRALESRHAKVLLGRVPLEGTIDELPEAPLHAFSFPLGDARAWLVEHTPSGLRLLFLSSAGFHEPALEGVGPVDVLLPAAMGRPPGYAEALVALRPRLVVPHHFDRFVRALDHPAAGEPQDGEDLEAFVGELRAAAEAQGHALEVRVPALFEVIEVEAAEGEAAP